ncbi:hypothetical protein AXG93_1712s1800 [Marchantia polymorpha subsp. ruderalis]|uniref:Uncharacterized protein n=1 Tax=Marchantia polymorpha subsp. ruderalis TaxID=1480154 RepID=A0A176VYZ5_MARPO|nr:hypothetical protein AXG93_1712s1800 [Marchantia polymorpha subsp. ruderalis]
MPSAEAGKERKTAEGSALATSALALDTFGEGGSSLTHYRFRAYPNFQRIVAAGARSDCQEFDGQVHSIEDGATAGAANALT